MMDAQKSGQFQVLLQNLRSWSNDSDPRQRGVYQLLVTPCVTLTGARVDMMGGTFIPLASTNTSTVLALLVPVRTAPDEKQHPFEDAQLTARNFEDARIATRNFEDWLNAIFDSAEYEDLP